MGHDFMEQIWFKTMFIVFAGFSSRQDVSFLKKYPKLLLNLKIINVMFFKPVLFLGKH